MLVDKILDEYFCLMAAQKHDMMTYVTRVNSRAKIRHSLLLPMEFHDGEGGEN
jgi:hypothetical protein